MQAVPRSFDRRRRASSMQSVQQKCVCWSMNRLQGAAWSSGCELCISVPVDMRRANDFTGPSFQRTLEHTVTQISLCVCKGLRFLFRNSMPGSPAPPAAASSGGGRRLSLPGGRSLTSRASVRAPGRARHAFRPASTAGCERSRPRRRRSSGPCRASAAGPLAPRQA